MCGGCGLLLTSVPRTPEPRASSPQSYTPKHLAEQVLASRAAIEGERKQVTVLFADMKSSLELLADRDPEEARKLLDPVLERMMEAVHRYEGTVNQVIGDGIMALFGASLAHLVALQHLPESRDTCEQAIDLRLELCAVLHALGEVGRIRDLVQDAEALAEALDDQRRLGQVSQRMCTSSYQMGDYARALASGQRVLAIGEAMGDVHLQFSANTSLGMTYTMLGDYGRAIECLRTRVSREGGAPTAARAWLSRCFAELGEFAAGLTHAEEGIRIAEAVDQPYDFVSAYSGAGYLYLRKGDLHKAISVLERGVELCRVWYIHLLFPGGASALGAAYALSDRVAEALLVLEQAVEQVISMRFMAHVSSGLVALSEGYLLAGRADDAMPLAQRALEHARQYNERGNEAWALRLLGKIVAQRDPPEGQQAEDHYRQAVALAEERGMRPLQAHCYLGLGTLYTKRGQREQARGELSAAIELCRAMEMTFWLPQAEAALAQVV